MLSNKRAKPYSSCSAFSLSVQIIGHNDDLLKEILFRLPNKSLVRFKSVSKHWQYSISNLKPFSNSPSALIIDKSSRKIPPEFDFVSLDSSDRNAPFESLTFANFPSNINILQSCNGLLLCRSHTYESRTCYVTYSVYNPTTKQHVVLPQFDKADRVIGVCLAFDPSKPSHYKVVCMRKFGRKYQIDLYSFEEGTWTFTTTETFSVSRFTLFEAGVYCNGAVNWLSTRGHSVYFNIEDEQVEEMPELPVNEKYRKQGRALYFGESRGHLHLVEVYDTQSRFDVFEMSSDYSEWRVKYSVNLNAVAAAFPEMVMRHVGPRQSILTRYRYQILYVGEGEGDENPFLVLNILSKIVKYDLKDGSIEKLSDIIPDFDEEIWSDNVRYVVSCKAYGYFESLASI